MRRRGEQGPAALLAAMTVAAGLAVTATVPAGAATDAKPQRCADVVQVWAGGMLREAVPDAVGLLPRAPSVRTVVAARSTRAELTPAHLRRLERRGVSDPYFAGYRERARKVVRALRTTARRCPGSMLAVGGHSDGAVVVRQALRSLSPRTDARVTRRLGVVFLVGDPMARRSDGEALNRVARGVLATTEPGLRLPSWVRGPAVKQLCQTADPVCNAQSRASDVPVHYSYDPWDLDDVDEAPEGTFVASSLTDVVTARTLERAFTISGEGGRARVRADLRTEWTSPVAVRATRLPKGLRLRHGVLTGRLAEGRHVAVVRVRSTRVAPAVVRKVKVVLVVERPAAAASTTLVTTGVDGRPADGPSSDVHVSRDGRTVVFASSASNLVAGDVPTGGAAVAYAWDAATQRTEVVGLTTDGRVTGSTPVDVSDDGRFVLFQDEAFDLYLRDRQQRTTTAVPARPDPAVTRGSGIGSLAGDGSFVDVGFYRDNPGFYRWSRVDGSVRRIPLDTAFAASSPDGSVAAAYTAEGVYARTISSGASGPVAPFVGNLWSSVRWADLSDGGRAVAVRVWDIDVTTLSNKVLDLATGTSLESDLAFAPDVSADGAWYTGDAKSWQLQVTRTDGTASHDAFVRAPRDADSRRTAPGSAALSGDGRVLAYTSAAVDLLPGVRPGDSQVYLWQVAR